MSSISMVQGDLVKIIKDHGVTTPLSKYGESIGNYGIFIKETITSSELGQTLWFIIFCQNSAQEMWFRPDEIEKVEQ